MKYGVATVLTDEGLDPLELARRVEELGFESLFLADHTHIPACRESPYPHPPFGELPRQYYRTLDPIAALSAMAAVTTSLRLGTGICLVVERDPIILAKQISTLDLLSRGRVLFGVGAGWNLEEMRNHGTDPSSRMALLAERVDAMRRIWTEDQAEYHGRFVDFDPIFSWPKPVQRPYPPVLVGGSGPGVLRRVLQFGDGWMPGHQRDLDALGHRIAELHRAADTDGRARPEVTVFSANPRRLMDYERIGIQRCLFLVDSFETDTARAHLERLADELKASEGQLH